MTEKTVKSRPNIVVLGGGTGSFMLLSALKGYANQLTAVVNMVDDGGSTGVLRDELGVLPPGDIRQCLVALSESPKIRDLFNYRFAEGTLAGHSFGNIFLTALEKATGSFSEAVETASEVLRVDGTVVPATLDNVHLRLEWATEGCVLNRECIIGKSHFKFDPRKAVLSLVPNAHANPVAVESIKNADIVVIAPGDLYASLGPLLVIDGIAEALDQTGAICVYVSNLVTKHGQTEGFTVGDHAAEIERLAGVSFLDYVIYNKQQPSKSVAQAYKQENAFLVEVDAKSLKDAHYTAVPGDFLGKMAVKSESDSLSAVRSLIRHDGKAVKKALFYLYSHPKTK